MAEARVISIELPELHGTSTRSPNCKCVLELETSKSYRGGVEAEAKVMWCNTLSRSHAFGLGGNGDFRKTYVTRPGIATQRRIDSLHAESFTDARIEQIKAEVRAFYGAEPATGTAMPDWIKQLHPGDQVFWNDPQAGLCSRQYQILAIEFLGDIIRIQDVDGSSLECRWEDLS